MKKFKNKCRTFKKVTACILASSLLTQLPAGLPVSVYGAAVSQPSKEEAVISAGSAARLSAAGQIEVGVRSSSLFPYEGAVTVELADADGKKETKELQLEQSESKIAFARFLNVQGDTTVTIRAKGFATYEQKITAQPGWTTKILVSSANFQTANGTQPGWMRPGDVNQDGVINKEDQTQMLNAIRNQSKETVYDINHDSSVDLADLQVLVQSLDEKQESAWEKHWTPNQVKLENGKIAAGDINNLLQGEQGITLQTANDAPVSASNPINLSFDLAQDGVSPDQLPLIGGLTVSAPLTEEETGLISSEIADGQTEVTYIDENGTEQKKTFPLAAPARMKALREAAGPKVEVEADGSLVLDFGGQIAVKRVTIKITGTTKKEQPLVNIARVEFVNDMEERIAPPQLDIPKLTSLTAGEKSFTAAWTAQKNITGYEVFVKGVVKGQSTPQEQIIRVSDNTHTISAIRNQSLKNYETYTVKVRSVNGDWSSQWSEEQSVQIIPQKKPAPPDYVHTEPGYSSITVTWKDMDDSAGYMVYYKSDKDADYQPVIRGFTQTAEGTGRLENNSYTITGLESETNYKVYVISWNQLGWSGPSLIAAVKTQSTAAPELPNYKLLNTPNGKGVLTSHITNAVIGGSNAKMIGSPLDTTAKSGLGLVDNDYASYWSKSDWDDGVAYPGANKGMTITLDAEYKMNYFTFTAADIKAGVQYVNIQYWNTKGGTQANTVGARLIEKRDANDHIYYIVKFDETVTANQIRMCLGRSSGNRTPMMVGEIHFHQYDSIEDDIMGLYTDDMHTVLRLDVTDDTINGLRSRLETVDPTSGEKHPLYKELSLELQTAQDILHGNLDPSYEVSSQITAAKDGHLGFSGLNAWQPLGKVAYTGEALLVFVGHNTKRTGDAAQLQLVFTQHHAEAVNVARTVNLKVGRNEITVPKLADTDCERGGQLYIAYTGNQPQDQYAVRIAGGSKIPVLNLYGKTKTARTEAIRTYVQELQNYVSAISDSHNKLHTAETSSNVDYSYQKENCILNATDILIDQMMYSLPATQVYAGLGSAADKASKLDQALKAMEDTMKLFYQHKGLSNDAGTSKGNHALPSQHLNIRYMRMFAGAFMYASGNHIGIEWGSSNLASAPNNWDGFGWGVAHEIGHNINQGTYAVAEITNNYFAQLLTKAVKGTRFDYKNVYSKVTSNMPGQSPNVATQLALYWQLHLAFDNQKDDRYLYDNYEEQFNNLFFARVDTYSRNPAAAPKSGLTLNGGTDQNLMRLSCAAANKNILPFFRRWGMEPDAETIAYAKQYGEEDQKALYYVNDAARDYRVDHLGTNEAGSILDKDVIEKANITVSGKDGENQKVQIQIASNLPDQSVLLGYEISRTMISNGAEKEEVIGFVQAKPSGDTVFTDTVTTVNNRVLSYQIRAVDQYLNYANTYQAGSVKISTDGALCKDNWTIETTMKSSDDTVILDGTDNSIDVTSDLDPDSGYDPNNPKNVEAKKEHSIDRAIDGDTGTVYTGSSESKSEITIDLHKIEQITSLKYWGSAVQISAVKVSQDANQWITVKENVTIADAKKEPGVIWFDAVVDDAKDTWIGTYDARYVKLIVSPGSVTINELTLCGPTGDNLEFMKTEDAQPAVGVLKADVNYGKKADDVIPKGSLIFTGTYKGNPAYNIVLLYDNKGNVIGSKGDSVLAKQVIFADVPANGQLGETKDGVWVYYLEPDQWKETENDLKGIEVRAELYRVDNAKTLEGERVVSDTEYITIPQTLPEITAVGNKIPSTQS